MAVNVPLDYSYSVIGGTVTYMTYSLSHCRKMFCKEKRLFSVVECFTTVCPALIEQVQVVPPCYSLYLMNTTLVSGCLKVPLDHTLLLVLCHFDS